MTNSTDLHFTYVNLKIEKAGYPDEILLERDVVGDFKILVGDRPLYSEIDFSLVDFSQQMKLWLSSGIKGDVDFLYDPLDSDVLGLIWIMKSSSGWQVGSPHATYAEGHTFSREEIQRASNEFVSKVENDIHQLLGFNWF